MMVIFSVTNWLQDVRFDACLLPMGDVGYHLSIRPVTEFSIEGDGLSCREGLPLGLEIKHPFNVLTKRHQWSLVYELAYMRDPNEEPALFTHISRDPLMFLGEHLLRHHDELLDHRTCLNVKYPP